MLKICNLFIPDNPFPPLVSHSILSIPLLLEVHEDVLIWNEVKNGIYMVRSGYCYVMRMSMKEVRRQVQGDWDSVWRAQVPPKVQNLIWRICRSCLLTRDRLNACHVSCPLHCELCENYVESDWHISFLIAIPVQIFGKLQGWLQLYNLGWLASIRLEQFYWMFVHLAREHC